MPLRFNNTELTPDEINKIVKDFMPKSKDKRVTFQRLNARPFQVMGARGMKFKAGSEKSIMSFCTAHLESKGEGILQYYKTSSKQPGRGGVVNENLEPRLVTFKRHIRIVDAEKDKALFAYMLCHSENEKSAAWSTIKPTFKLVRPAEDAKRKVANIDLKIEALQMIKNLKESNKQKLRQLYEAKGFTDWDIHVPTNHQGADWDTILQPLYAIAESEPQSILSAIEDTALDVAAKVSVALDNGILKYEAGKFFMKGEGDVFKELVKVPTGKTEDETARNWFVNYLKGKGSDALDELNIELETAKLTRGGK